MRFPFISRVHHEEAIALLKQQIADLQEQRAAMWRQLTEPQTAPAPAPGAMPGVTIPLAPGFKRDPRYATISEQIQAEHNEKVQAQLEAKGQPPEDEDEELASGEIPGGRRALRRGGPHARAITYKNLREFHAGARSSVMSDLFETTRREAEAAILAAKAAVTAPAETTTASEVVA